MSNGEAGGRTGFRVVRVSIGSIDRDHAVPGPIGFEIVRLDVGRGMGPLEFAEIRDLFPAAVATDANYAVAGAR